MMGRGEASQLIILPHQIGKFWMLRPYVHIDSDFRAVVQVLIPGNDKRHVDFKEGRFFDRAGVYYPRSEANWDLSMSGI
jgi:hypothetical protein